MRHAFCESVWAGPRSRWHIRRVGAEGLQPGGGAPGPPLCGLMGEQWSGWDIEVEITRHHLDKSACQTCAQLYRGVAYPRAK